MATYTILRNSVKNNRSDVIIEFPVPTTSNDAGLGWRSVIAGVRAADGVAGSVNPLKASNASHVADLDAGRIIEIPLTVEYDAKMSNTQKVAVLDVAVIEKVASFTSEFGSLYRFYGTTRTV